jgi:hypothetical protein
MQQSARQAHHASTISTMDMWGAAQHQGRVQQVYIRVALITATQAGGQTQCGRITAYILGKTIMWTRERLMVDYLVAQARQNATKIPTLGVTCSGLAVLRPKRQRSKQRSVANLQI